MKIQQEEFRRTKSPTHSKEKNVLPLAPQLMSNVPRSSDAARLNKLANPAHPQPAMVSQKCTADLQLRQKEKGNGTQASIFPQQQAQSVFVPVSKNTDRK